MLQTCIIIFILLNIISWVGLAQIFKKAGVDSWKAFVPLLNWSEWLKLIGKPQWWIVLMCIPVVNFFYGAYMLTGMARAFKHYDFGHHLAAVLGFWAYLPYLGFSKNEKYYGIDGVREGEHKPEFTKARNWIDSIIFAVLAAHFIRMFFIEAYAIPTSSMESSLQIGDYMFVSKAHYGSRIPNTPLSLPLIHHTIPKTNSRAYSEAIKFDYHRLPGLQKIKRNDIVVFNIPFEHNMQGQLAKGYYPNIKYKSRPVDKREHYIKRAVAIPGDELEVKDNQLYINGEMAKNPENIQFEYEVEATKSIPNEEWREMGVRAYKNYFNGSRNPSLHPTIDRAYFVNMSPEVAKQIELNPAIKSVKLRIQEATPNYTELNMSERGMQTGSSKNWVAENFGPLKVPKKGMTIPLTADNISHYIEAIDIYEGNDVEIKDGVYINGEKVVEYTFKMDYYFMMGDNRHASLDSRAWGFVPEDHIVGKPLFIFFSRQAGAENPGFRWNRFFRKAQDMN